MYTHNILFAFQSMGASHGFDHYRANMFRHLTTLRNTHDSKDHSSHVKHVNNWMETSEINVKSEKSVSLYSSHPADNKHTPQRTTSPKPFTSDPPDSANVHKPQPVKNGSTPPNYENQNEFEKFMYGSKLDVQSDEKSGNSEKTDKSQFSFKSWLKREPGKRHNSGESKSSGDRTDQSIETIKRQSAGETTLSKLRHTVVQKFSSSSSKQRNIHSIQSTSGVTDQSFQTPPSYVPLNLNVNDIDPYETSLGRESRFGTMSSEIDLRSKPFDKGGLNSPEFQVNSAERRSKFDASKFTYKGMRQGSDLSTEYASLYHTPPFSSPPVTHIDKDGYASPIVLNSVSKSDINNNEPKNRGSGRDVPPRNRAPLALGSNISISDAYRRTDGEQTDAKRFNSEKSVTSSTTYPTSSSVSRTVQYPKDTPTSRHFHSRDPNTYSSDTRYQSEHSNSETTVKSVYPLHESHGNEKPSSHNLINNHQLSSHTRSRENSRDAPAKPERVLERYPGSQNLSINHDITHKDSRSGNQYGVSNDHVDNRHFLSKSGMNRPPITSLIKRFEKDNEQDPIVEYTEQSNKQTMLSTSTPITPRRPMTLHEEDDDDPPPLPPRYDFHTTPNKYGLETNQHFTPQLPDSNTKVQRTPIKSIHTRESTGTSEQEDGYKDKLRKAATSAVFERYKTQTSTTPQYNSNRQGGQSQTPQYGRQGSNQSQFSQQSSLTQATSNCSSRPYNRPEDTPFSNPTSATYIKQTPQQQTPQTRKPGLGRFGNIHHPISSDNRSSIHL